jgi:hypothetical protein
MKIRSDSTPAKMGRVMKKLEKFMSENGGISAQAVY